ncbi:hypothetical protein RUND412_007594 [Rhizina undulata]
MTVAATLTIANFGKNSETVMSQSESDLKVASIAFGFFIGFGFLTTWEVIKQTRRARDPLRSLYIWMIWGEVCCNTAIAIQGYLFLGGVVAFDLPYAFVLLSLWVFELQLLMQIIINRVSIVMSDKRKATRIKYCTALLVSCVNITVFCIWIPAKLQVSERYIAINDVWDRCEKVIILIIDAALNWYFMKVVKARLVSQGLTKYDALVRFNVRIVMVSLAMDVMIIGLMSLKNGAVYIQLHPVAYIVKLNIEMSMASLITKIAREHTDFELSSTGKSGRGGRSGHTHPAISGAGPQPSLTIHTQKDVIVESQSINENDKFDNSSNSSNQFGYAHSKDSDDRPLKEQSAWNSPSHMGHSVSVNVS